MADERTELSFGDLLSGMDSAELRALGSVVRRAHAFDAMAEAAAIIDPAGVIVETNDAWRLFAELNGARPGTTGVGVDYLAVCDRAAASGAAPEAAAAARGLRAILARQQAQLDLEYRADSAAEDRWFLIRAAAVPVGDATGAVIVHHNVSGRKFLESGLLGASAVDPVTGLPDWSAATAYVGERLVAAATAGGRVTVMVLDIDRFATVNERLGRAAGDELLVQVGARARRVVRQGDLLSRLAADQFLLVFREVQVVDVAPVRARLAEAVAHPYQVGASEVEVRAQIGVLASVDDDTVDSLLGRALEATRRRKPDGREPPAITTRAGAGGVVADLAGPHDVTVVRGAGERDEPPAHEPRRDRPPVPVLAAEDPAVAPAGGEVEGTLAAQALHAALTNLPDRRALVDNMTAFLDARSVVDGPATLLLVDFTNLQRVYDGFGQLTGDRLVFRCAQSLQLAAHAGDLLARFSDRTFAVFCGHVGTRDLAVSYAERLREAVARPTTIEGRTFEVLASVGIASTDGAPAPDGDGPDALELVQQAHAALSLLREEGRHGTRIYDEALRDTALRQLDMEALVRKAIETRAVRIAYQPVVRLDDGAVDGGEALLRLTDDGGDPVEPMEIVAAAERIGAVRELSRLILETACRHAAGWRETAPGRPVLLSINVPGTLLADSEFPPMASEIVASAGLAPSSLCLEVNESVLMESPLRSVTQLVDLKVRGFRLAVDDFGTGYSSLAHLKRFPLDILKVDESLISGLAQNLEDAAIVRAIIGVADALGLAVVAEGVEQEDQCRELERLGIGYGQGYLWSGAMRPDAFAALLSADRDRRDTEAESRPAPRRSARASSPPPGAQESLDAVLSVLAHEIRTPLSVITGYASLLEESLGPQESDAAATIVRAGQRIGRILANIVDTDAANEGALQLKLRPVDAGELVSHLLGDLATPVAKAVDYEPPIARRPIVLADQTRIEQTLNNLVTNAVKYSPPGSRVRVEVVAEADWIDIVVTDEGPGIPPEQIGLIFRKYGRASAVPGTGLGLYLARTIARAHGGEIIYRRRNDRTGSIFVLRLPRSSEDAVPVSPLRPS